MSFRFRKRIRIAPGLSLNVGKKGLSVSAGVRGASVTYGSRGVYGNVGLPGTGVSYRTRLDNPAKRGSSSASRNPTEYDIPARIVLREDGKLDILLQDGTYPSPAVLKKIKAAAQQEIQVFLNEKCEEKNKKLKDILEIHHQTPNSNQSIRYILKTFNEKKPFELPVKRHGLLSLLFKSHKQKIEGINQSQAWEYKKVLQEWDLRREAHDNSERHLKNLYEHSCMTSVEGMSACFEHRMSDIDWVLETDLSYGFSHDLATAYIDVDLPEIEDMPNESATVSDRPLGLKLKKISDTDIRKSYMQHSHGIIFRVLGEAFACLPTLNRIIVSGYSQRTNKATGIINDEYLISLCAERSDWGRIDLSNIRKIDPVLGLQEFDLRRNMTKTGSFKPIEPFRKN